MASSSEKSSTKANLLGKREPEDDLESKPVLKKHKEKPEEKETTEGVELLEKKSDDDQANLISVEERVEGLDEPPESVEEVATLFVGELSPNTKISDIIDFFNDAEAGRVVVSVRLIVDHKGNHVGCGYVEFSSSNEAKKALEKKNGEYLHDHKIFLELANKNPQQQHKYYIDHNVICYKDYLQREGLLIGEDEPADFVEEVLFVANLSPQTKIFHIIDFFDNVGEVVSVRLIVNHEGKHVGFGFVEFASSNEAKKALARKKGEYLHDHKIFLNAAKTAPRTKYNLAEKLCYEDYLRRESLMIEEDKTVEGLDERADFVEAVAVRKKMLFVGHLSRQTKISDIINFFNDAGRVVVSVRLIVDHKGNHVGYGFVEFASANEANKALEKKNGEILHDRKLYLELAKIAPHPPPKYCLDHKVWYEDYLGRESLLIEEDETVEGLVEEVAVRKKTLFVANLPRKTKISDIIKFFEDVGEVVNVGLIVNHKCKHVGCGFVEFPSAKEAKKARLKKNGEYLHNVKIYLAVAEIAPYPLRPKYNLAEKLWYQQESLLIEEDDLETKPNLKKQKVPNMSEFRGKKITFPDEW